MHIGEIHIFEKKGRKLLLDVNAAAFYGIDDVTEGTLNALSSPEDESALKKLQDKYGNEAVNQTIRQLRELGILSDKPEITRPLLPLEDCAVNDLALNVSHHCNLRCRYCYGDAGHYGGPAAQMTEKVGRAAVDFLLRESREEKKCHLLFFGGEPLLNFDLIRRLVPYALNEGEKSGKQVVFTVVTNGTLFSDEILDFFDQYRVWVEVSIDGPKDVHDALRVYADGHGSYDDIIPGVKKLMARRPGLVPARATVTHINPAFMETVLHLIDLGFGSVDIDVVSGNGGSWSITESDREIIEKEFDRAAEYYLDKVDRKEYFAFSPLTRVLDETFHPRKRRYHCGCGKNYLAVAPSGDIYACHRFVGRADYRMGHVSGTIDLNKRQMFLENSVDNREACRRCWARYFCGGGCNYQAVEATGSIAEPDRERCRLIRHLIELSMMIYSEMHSGNRAILNKIAALTRRP